MRGALTELQRLEVPHIDRTLRELLVEIDNQRLIFWADRPDHDLFAILHRPFVHVLHGIRADRRPAAVYLPPPRVREPPRARRAPATARARPAAD